MLLSRMANRTRNRSTLKTQDLRTFSDLDYREVEKELAQLLGESSQKLESLCRLPLERIRKLRSRVSEEFIEREDAVDAVLASLVSGVPMVMLGPPGTGKSAIVRRIAVHCGLDGIEGGRGYFEYLMHAHTMPENLFGPPDIKGLQADEPRFERLTRNYLPEAQIAFLDEVFRGGSHILNTLLTLINERIFHNGYKPQEVPLVGVIGAANFQPDDPELAAFYDRFPIRVWLDSVFEQRMDGRDPDQSIGQSLLDKSIALDQERRSRYLLGSRGGQGEAVSCINDLRAASAEVARCARSGKLGSNNPRRKEFERIFLRLRTDCDLSDRSYNALWKFATALAVLGGEQPEDDQSHIAVFGYVASTQENLTRIRGIVEQELGRQHDGED
jgi:MoxR-like ATPase